MSTNKPVPPCPLCGAAKDQESLSGFVACNCGLELPRSMYMKICEKFAELEAENAVRSEWIKERDERVQELEESLLDAGIKDADTSGDMELLTNVNEMLQQQLTSMTTQRDDLAYLLASMMDCPAEMMDADLDCENRCEPECQSECWKLYVEGVRQ